jgi:chloride channel protein, CIC family
VAAARIVKLGERENAVLATAGSFSAISALFGGPLPAGVLMVEAGLGMGAALIPVMLPGLVAAACGYVIFIGLGDWAGLESTKLVVPDLPAYDGTTVGDLLLAIAIGIVTAVLVIGARKLGRRVHAIGDRGVSMPVLLLGGAVAVGCLTLIVDALGGDSPEVLFSGQAALPDILAEGSAGVLIAIVLAKVIAYGICLGCGFRGGPVFPAIFTGVAVATLTVVALDTSPTFAVAVGTAAGMAAATRLLIASLVVAALLVGTNGIDAISAAVLAAAAAWLVGHVLDPPPPAPAPPPPAPA